MNQHTTRTIMSWILTISMLLSMMIVPVYGQELRTEEQVALEFRQTENGSAKLAEEAEADLEASDIHPYEDADVVRVSIVLEEASTLEAFSSEFAVSTASVAENAQIQTYRTKLEKRQDAVTDKIEAALDAELDVVWNLTLAANMISANVTYGQIEEIAEVEGVKEVVIETLYSPTVMDIEEESSPNMATSTEMIGSSAAWASGYTGAGSRIAVIDTGIDADHEAFSADAYMYSLEYQATLNEEAANAYLESLNLLTADEIAGVRDQLNVSAKYDADDLYVSAKIPFGYNYVDTDTDITHDNDDQGAHGSHVAGIAAANAYVAEEDGTYSNALNTTYVRGVAPDAQIIVMKVFGKNGGAYESDYMAAIEDAIILGCDSVNLSLGSSTAGFSRCVAYAEVMEKLTESGIVVCTSAGNSYSWAYYTNPYGYLRASDVNLATGGSPGTFTNVLSSASVNNAGITGMYFTIGEEAIFYTETTGNGNAAMTTIAGEHEYVMIDGYGTDEDFAAISEALSGKIAVCYRGNNSFYEKCNAAVKYGAIATVIVNNQSGSISMNLAGYSYTAPAVSVTMQEGEMLKSAAKAVTDDEGSTLYYTGTLTVHDNVKSTVSDSEYYTMSDFSSWGVPGTLEIKPEITAPGGSIYSVDGSVATGDAYVNMSGTSMASPQTAGMVALLAQYIRENGLTETTGLSSRQLIQSLLMSTAEPILEEESGNYYSVLKQGSGLANVGNALNANSYILMDENANAGAADGKVKAELGDDPDRTGRYQLTFTLNNMSDTDKSYTLSNSFFTQSVFSYEDELWLDTLTTALSVNAAYTVDGVSFVPTAKLDCDLNNDGITDAQDAAIILNYVVGNLDDIDDIADLNGDNAVTSYDAHLLLSSLETAQFVVKPGKDVEIKVSITLSDETKSMLDSYYENGAYVEGYVFVNPTSNEEGVIEDVTHSIPVLGFYGNWSDPSMYEPSSLVDYYYAGDDYKANYTYNIWVGDTIATNDLIIKYRGDINEYYTLGNNYYIEDSDPAERAAINSSTFLYQYETTYIRSAAAVMVIITDQNGNVLYADDPYTQVQADFYYDSSWGWYYSTVGVPINRRVSSLGVKEDDQITVSLVSVPEYYEENGALTSDEIVKLVQNGTLGKGAFLSETFTVDNTAPEVSGVYKNISDDESNELLVVASDNNFIAAVQIFSLDGETCYAGGVPAQTEAGQNVTVSFDLSELENVSKVMVVVADYANNESSYVVEINPEVKEDNSGKMYTFTTTDNYRGTGPRWMEVDPDMVYYMNANFNGGTENLDYVMPFTVTAAEYLEDYVFMAGDDGGFYVAPFSDFSDVTPVGRWDTVVNAVYDMAYNYADNTMYFIADGNYICSLDVVNGTVQKLYYVTTVNPKMDDDDEEPLGYLQCLAIDDDGNFYSIGCEGQNKASYNFLYKWDNSKVSNGSIKNLKPVVNTKKGYTGAYNYPDVPHSLAWDHDSDTLYFVNSYNKTGKAESDYQQKWIYTVNTTTGKATKCGTGTGYPANSAAYRPGLMATTNAALFIVPSSDDSNISAAKKPTNITVSKTELTLYKGELHTLVASLSPWLVEDSGLIWSTDDENIAKVSQTGVVTATGVGTTTITVASHADSSVYATCQVTVKEMDAVDLNAFIYDAEGNGHWIEFNTNEPENYTVVGDGDARYIGGHLDGRAETIYANDGKYLYSIDPDLFTSEVISSISFGYCWSDSSAAEPASNGNFGYAGAIANFGTTFELVNCAGASLSYFDLSKQFETDPMALVAFKDSEDYENKPSNAFYVMTESGTLYIFHIYASLMSLNVEYEYVGQTQLDLFDVSSVTGDAYGSMYLDEESGYLYVTASTGEGAHLYAVEIETCTTYDCGCFGEDTHVGSLYQHQRITNLTVTMGKDTASVYEEDSLQLTAKVKPAVYTGGVTWSSDDKSVAVVDENGLVTGLKPGTAIITATSVDTENGEHASASCEVTVKANDQVNVDLNLQVEDDGIFSWVSLNGNDVKDVTVLGEDVTEVAASAAIAGTLYVANTDGGIYTIDPETHKALTDPVSLTAVDEDGEAYTLTIADMTYVPATDYYGYVGHDCLAVITTDGEYLFISDLKNGEYIDTFSYLTRSYMENIRAITYLGKGSYSTTKVETAVVALLSYDGNLYTQASFTSALNYDTNRATNYASAGYTYLGNIGINFGEDADLTMEYINDGTYDGFIICDGSALYFVDRETLTVYKLGNLDSDNATTVFAVSKLESDAAQDAAEDFVPVEATDSTASSNLALWLPAVLEESASGVVAKGSLNAVVGEAVVAPGINKSGSSAEAADKTVTLYISEDIAVTNGKITVSYDPKVLSYEGCTSSVTCTAENSAEGTVTFAYASGSAIPAKSVLAAMSFTSLSDSDTVVTITTRERNKDVSLSENTIVDVVFKTEPPYTPGSNSGSDNKSDSETETKPVIDAGLPFTDVKDADWFYNDVVYVYEKGLMNGVTGTTFEPLSETTRGMIVTILWRMDGQPAPANVCQFKDVASGSYYEKAIAWAAEKGVVTGISETEFRPDDSITREQLATILYRYAQYKGLDTSVGEDTNILSYADAFDISDYAFSAMQWACGAGLINGIEGKLVPAGYATRAQVAAILHRFCENVK